MAQQIDKQHQANICKYSFVLCAPLSRNKVLACVSFMSDSSYGEYEDANFHLVVRGTNRAYKPSS